MTWAVAPDDGKRRAPGQKPTSMEGETDVDFLRGVWSQAAKGTPPAACEASLPVDAYRVRRLYAHWLESGCGRLQRAAPEPMRGETTNAVSVDGYRGVAGRRRGALRRPAARACPSYTSVPAVAQHGSLAAWPRRVSGTSAAAR